MKKVLYAVMSFIVLFSVLAFSGVAADSNTTHTSGDYEYSVLKDGSVQIEKYNGNATKLVIASKRSQSPVQSKQSDSVLSDTMTQLKR